MKDQYFGDVKDYLKYGLLRALVAGSGLRAGVCWMLTPDDGSGEGRKLGYLCHPDEWRAPDPDLFDQLRLGVLGRSSRRVADAAPLLPGAAFHADLVPEDPTARAAWLACGLGRLAGADLVFFDPDNGLEVKSCPRRLRLSAKHLYWDEFRAFFGAGASVLVFQHFPRETRARYVARRLAEVRGRLAAGAAGAFVTPEVVFLLAAQPRHVAALRAGAAEVERHWGRRGVAGAGIEVRFPAAD